MRRILVAGTLATAGLFGAASVASATAFTVLTQDGSKVTATYLGLLPKESCVLAAVDGSKYGPSDFDTVAEVIDADEAILARPSFKTAESKGPFLALTLDFAEVDPGRYLALAFCYTSDGDGVDAISTKEFTIGPKAASDKGGLFDIPGFFGS